MDELVELVNKTNARLLYKSLMENLQKAKTSVEEEEADEEYELLNVFEMLWNVVAFNDTPSNT